MAQEKLKDFIQATLRRIRNLISGICMLLFWDSIKGVVNFTKDHRKSAKNSRDYIALVTSGLLIIGFVLYGLIGLYSEITHYYHRKYYEKVLFQDYESEVKDFFNKYNERYAAHDCGFMAEVGADEAMYEKYGNTTYKNYKCEEFFNTQHKMLIPYKIDPVKKDGKRYHVRGQAIVVQENQGQPLRLDVINFALRKRLDRELRHFNSVDPNFRRVQATLDTNKYVP